MGGIEIVENSGEDSRANKDINKAKADLESIIQDLVMNRGLPSHVGRSIFYLVDYALGKDTENKLLLERVKGLLEENERLEERSKELESKEISTEESVLRKAKGTLSKQLGLDAHKSLSKEPTSGNGIIQKGDITIVIEDLGYEGKNIITLREYLLEYYPKYFEDKKTRLAKKQHASRIIFKLSENNLIQRKKELFFNSKFYLDLDNKEERKAIDDIIEKYVTKTGFNLYKENYKGLSLADIIIGRVKLPKKIKNEKGTASKELTTEQEITEELHIEEPVTEEVSEIYKERTEKVKPELVREDLTEKGDLYLGCKELKSLIESLPKEDTKLIIRVLNAFKLPFESAREANYDRRSISYDGLGKVIGEYSLGGYHGKFNAAYLYGRGIVDNLLSDDHGDCKEHIISVINSVDRLIESYRNKKESAVA